MSYEHNKAWRKRNPELRQAQTKRYYAQTQGAPKTKQIWTDKEIARITAENRPTDRELAAELGRSVKAIHMKRGRVK